MEMSLSKMQSQCSDPLLTTSSHNPLELQCGTPGAPQKKWWGALTQWDITTHNMTQFSLCRDRQMQAQYARQKKDSQANRLLFSYAPPEKLPYRQTSGDHNSLYGNINPPDGWGEDANSLWCLCHWLGPQGEPLASHICIHVYIIML